MRNLVDSFVAYVSVPKQRDRLVTRLGASVVVVTVVYVAVLIAYLIMR